MAATTVRTNGRLYLVYEGGSVYRSETSLSVIDAEPHSTVTVVLVTGTEARRAIEAAVERLGHEGQRMTG